MSKTEEKWDLEITPNTTDHGYVARYAEEIVPVTPAEASYRASDADYAVQTVYISGEDVSFRIRPADPERDGYDFDGWSDGSQKAGRYDIVTLPADAIELTATWASLTISAAADDQETLTEIPVSYTVTVSGEGDMVLSVESCTGGEAVLDGNVIRFTPSSTDSTVTAVIVVHITNGHASTDVSTEVLVDPVLEFTADVTEGTLEASE